MSRGGTRDLNLVLLVFIASGLFAISVNLALMARSMKSPIPLSTHQGAYATLTWVSSSGSGRILSTDGTYWATPCAVSHDGPCPGYPTEATPPAAQGR